MKPFSPGLSDSIASLIADPRPCPHCDSSSHIAGGLCVGCLLEAGLDPADEGESETLTGILAEVNLPDQNWRLGNYEILEEIGRGGMGVIYRARQRHSRRIVAVKRVLSYHSDSRETLARFRREAQAAASLDHPNILPIFEVSESDDGLPFFSMKFAPGGTLQQVAPALRNEPRQCVALVAKIARAVQYAHSRGILHRDLKPGNILLDGRGEPLVSDFGLAKWLDTTSELTRTLTIFGTPGYIAPEQASNSAADLKPTADIYSLGAILFDLLAGRPPFLGAHALSVIRQAADSPAPKLRTLSKVADRDLETICSRCLERDPKLRYPSAHDLAEDLERWLEGRPIIARPVLPPVRVWRWSRRNPVLTSAFGISAVLAVIGLIGTMTTSRLSEVVRQEAATRTGIAVAPIEDLDELSTASTKAQEMTLNLVNSISKRNSGRVILTSDQFGQERAFWKPEHWQTIGKRTQTRFVVQGTIRQRHDNVRLVYRVLDSTTGVQLLRDIRDFSPTQIPTAAIIHQIITQVVAHAGDAGIPVNNGESAVSASNSRTVEYLKTGKEYFFRYRPDDVKTALSYFSKAIQEDAYSGEAYALYSMACLQHAHHAPSDSPDHWRREAKDGSKRAIALAPDLALAHRAAALVAADSGAYEEAIEEGLCAIELDPEDQRPAGFIAHSWFSTGRPDLALRWYKRAADRGDRAGLEMSVIGDAYTMLGDDASAENAYNSFCEFFPDLPDGLVGLTWLRVIKADFEGARKLAQQALIKYPDHPYPLQMAAELEFFARNFRAAAEHYRKLHATDPNGGVLFYGNLGNTGALGFAEITLLNTINGGKLLDEAIQQRKTKLAITNDQSDLYDLAGIRAGRGEIEEALDALHAAAASGWLDYRALELDPRFDALRNKARYQEIVQTTLKRVASLRTATAAAKVATK